MLDVEYQKEEEHEATGLQAFRSVKNCEQYFVHVTFISENIPLTSAVLYLGHLMLPSCRT